MGEEVHYTPADGNVFADLGLANAEELLAKADLAIQITHIIEARGLTQAQAAAVLCVDQPKVSALVRGRLAGFSLERLTRFLNALGSDVEIVVRPKPASRKQATLRVVAERAQGGQRPGERPPGASGAGATPATRTRPQPL